MSIEAFPKCVPDPDPQSIILDSEVLPTTKESNKMHLRRHPTYLRMWFERLACFKMRIIIVHIYVEIQENKKNLPANPPAIKTIQSLKFKKTK